MWSHEGIYMGVLIESIPEGVKSSQWFFETDVQAAIDNEAELVTELVVKVKDLLKDTEKPELESFDFYGLNKGEIAPEFTQSELRKRISETSSILGYIIPSFLTCTPLPSSHIPPSFLIIPSYSLTCTLVIFSILHIFPHDAYTSPLLQDIYIFTH